MEKEVFLKNFADQFDDTDTDELTMETEFHELEEWSSMIALSILNMVAKKYGYTMTFEDLKKCVTVEDIYNLVASKVG